MAQIVFQPPNAILFVAIGVFVLGLASTLLKKGEWRRKITAMVIIAVVAGALVVVLYRPTTLSVDEDGFSLSGINGVEVSWEDVQRAYLEPDLRSSPYRPTLRTRGIALGDYRSGRFALSNGNPARVMMERSDQAVVILTDDLTYLLAPDDMDLLVAAVNQYYTRPEAAQ